VKHGRAIDETSQAIAADDPHGFFSRRRYCALIA
jgi:hypothetical protein